LKPAVKLGESKIFMRAGKVIGWIYHVPTSARKDPNVIRLQLNATQGENNAKVVAVGGSQQQLQPPIMPPLTAPAPSGTWAIELQNTGTVGTTFHAWIARDDVRVRSRRRRQQSRFDERDADPRSTLADLATGDLTICVGAHNAATGETCAYSACGPTRDERKKPDVTAPAEETAAGGGILCASSRRAQPSRFNGTSAAAPHVTGLVALLMQFNRDTGGNPLSVEQIRKKIVDGAQAAKLLPPPPLREDCHNRHQEVDPHRRVGKRQADHFADVTGAGKINVPKSV
jgi:subtilisin family serine protease